MPDRIYTYQQSLILQYIETLEFLLTQPFRNRRQIKELTRAIKKYTDRDKGCPLRLKYDTFLGNGCGKHWEDRTDIEDIKDWLIELHTYYDEVGSSTAAR